MRNVTSGANPHHDWRSRPYKPARLPANCGSRAYVWFTFALRRGDLVGVRAAAGELGRDINLVDALAVVLLTAAHDDDAFDRAATRWLARFVYERPAVGLDELRLGVTALEALPHNPDAAKIVLSELCLRHRLDGVIGLLA
ncbi:MAG: hypothetical protein E6G10_10210 [Actinobacteria bacterium]|nr:MAG: hypothetical protein E6G10_10210 [Actinomycetota bacterium]